MDARPTDHGITRGDSWVEVGGMKVRGQISIAQDHVLMVSSDNANITIVLDGAENPGFRKGEHVELILRPCAVGDGNGCGPDGVIYAGEYP